MGDRVKSLGLILAAMLATSAVLAAAAEALEAEVEGGGTANVTGTTILHNGTTSHTFTTFFGSITCSTIRFEGGVSNGATTITLRPTYEGCTVGTKPVTITMNECRYTFHGGVTVLADTYKEQEVDLGECKEKTLGVEVHVYENATKHGSNQRLCTYLIRPFVNLKGQHVEDTTTASPKKDVDTITTIENIAVERTFGTLLSCGTQTQSQTYTGATTLRAYSDAGHTNQIGIALK